MLILLLLLTNPLSDGIYEHTYITAEPAIIVNESINITIKNSIIASNNFMQINCQEDFDIGLTNCSEIKISLQVTNSKIYSNWIIYSDNINTENITINKNWYYNYNGYDSLYVWEHNHDIIDYNPKAKRLNKATLEVSI